MLLEDLIAHNLDVLFPGMHVRASYLFRVTRDADLDLQEDEADDLLRAIESELRNAASASRCGSKSKRACPNLFAICARARSSSSRSICYEVDGMMALSDLWPLVNLPRLRAAARRAVHAGDSQAVARRHRHVRGDSRRRHAAAPSVRVVRSGRAVRAAGGGRSERCSRSSRRSTAPRARLADRRGA